MSANFPSDAAHFAKFQENFHRFMQHMLILDSNNNAQLGLPTTSDTNGNSKEEKNQIVLFNLPEPSGGFAARKAKDLESATEILRSIFDQINIETVHRYGKFDFSQQKPRKLIVQLATKDYQMKILRNSGKLKKSEDWKSISIKKPYQQKQKETRVENDQGKQTMPFLVNAFAQQLSVSQYPAPSSPSTKRKKSKLKDETVETVTKSTKPEVPLNPFRNFDTAEPPTVQKERNIVIIGETGVGKSTWMNGIANYIKFDSFDDALNGKKPICVIPMEFNVYTGEKFEKSTISMKAQTLESEKNEANASTGQSCTQAPKVYRFITDTVAFNLIDTPGIGDTRGLECDMENMRMIMKCVSKWDKIHGICLLLKPNVSRLTLSLRYCIVELLANLHRNAIPNVSVVFTNSCNTLYKPGDTMTVLRKLFEDVKNENQNEIPLTSANTFCLDNEPVRMLYAHHKGVQFEKACVNNFLKSWNHTVRETYKLFDSVTDLDPHLANETKVVSIVRAVTHELCTILADFDERIRQEQKALDQQMNLHKILEQKLADTKKEVFQGTYLKETPISQPNTVCCGPNCVETIRDPTTNALKTFHKRVCFQSCSVQNVPLNQIGATNLRQCPIFAQVGNCSVCGCSWQSHMHILYSQRKRVGKVKAGNKEENYPLTQQILNKSLYNKYLVQLSQLQLQVLRERYQKAQELAKPFFAFLQENLIVSVNSAFEEYAEFSIEQLEQTLKTGSDRYEIDKLKKLLAIHQQQKFLASEKPSEQEEITLANYSLRILELKDDLIVGTGLRKSSIYKKIFDFPDLDVVEVATKTNLIVQYRK